MTVEVSTYISQLNSALPAVGDLKSEGDEHIRKIKANLQSTFPNLTAAPVTASTTELNFVDGVTSPIQTQLDAKASITYVDTAVGGGATYTPSVTGGVARTVATKLDDLVSAFDFMTTAQIADVKAGTVTLDVTTALQAAFDSGKSVYMPAGVYKTTSELVFKNGTRVYGAGNWSAVQQTDINTNTTVIYYAGAGGANSCVVRMSKAAVGTDPGTLSASDRTLMNAAFCNITIQGNDLAEFGLYMARAWSNNQIDYVTVTGTTKAAFWAALCWNGSPTNWIAYKNKGAGISLGENFFSWTATNVDQSTCTSFFGYYSGFNQSLVKQSVFDETTNKSKEYGIGVFASRALTLINAQAAGCSGAGIYTTGAYYPVYFVGGYNEGNGTSTSSTANWDIWVEGDSSAGTWNQTFSHFHLGLTPSIRLSGTAPSRTEHGVVFERMARLGTIKADWDNFRIVDSDRNVTYSGTSTAPNSPEYLPAGLRFTATGGVFNSYTDPTAFTPSFSASGVTFGYTTQTGYYTRVGRMVMFWGRIVVSSITGTSATVTITGLPVAAAASLSGASLTFSRVLNLTTAVVSLSGTVSSSGTSINMYKRTAAAASESSMLSGDLSATTDMAFSGYYFA